MRDSRIGTIFRSSCLTRQPTCTNTAICSTYSSAAIYKINVVGHRNVGVCNNFGCPLVKLHYWVTPSGVPPVMTHSLVGGMNMSVYVLQFITLSSPFILKLTFSYSNRPEVIALRSVQEYYVFLSIYSVHALGEHQKYTVKSYIEKF